MTWIVEQPLPILFAGAFAFAITAGIWTQTRHRLAALGMLAVLLLTGLFLGLEWLVVTEGEKVEGTLYQIASEMERNDIAAVAGHVSTSQPELRAEVERILSRVTVQKVSIKRNLKVTVVGSRGHPSAMAKFNAVATLKDSSGFMGLQTVPRYVIVNFRKEQGRWRVVSYEQRDFRRGANESTPTP